MTKFRPVTHIALLLILAGVLCIIDSFKDAMLLIKGDKINFNTATQSDYLDTKLIEGDFNLVFGPIGWEDEEQRRFGFIPTSKKVYYYMTMNVTGEQIMNAINKGEDLEDMISYYVVFVKVTDDDRKALFDDASYESLKFLNAVNMGEFKKATPPASSLHFEGKLVDKSKDTNYQDFLMQANTIANSNGVGRHIVEYVIEDGEVSVLRLVQFISGIVVIIAGLLMLIIPIIVNKKRESREEFY